MGSFATFLTEVGPRIKRVRIRIRGGKVQRNVKISNVKGFRLSHGKLVRMSASEKLHRKRGARRAKFKLKSKRARILMKRARSMRRRHSLGL